MEENSSHVHMFSLYMWKAFLQSACPHSHCAAPKPSIVFKIMPRIIPAFDKLHHSPPDIYQHLLCINNAMEQLEMEEAEQPAIWLPFKQSERWLFCCPSLSPLPCSKASLPLLMLMYHKSTCSASTANLSACQLSSCWAELQPEADKFPCCPCTFQHSSSASTLLIQQAKTLCPIHNYVNEQDWRYEKQARAMWCESKRLIILQKLFPTSQHPSWE